MELSTDPEDLVPEAPQALPQIEDAQRGGQMAADNDFSAIVQLMDVKHLYEEQEEKWRLRLTEKDAEDRAVRGPVERRAASRGGGGERPQRLLEEINRLKSEYERVQRESQAKIAQLNERIRELNQRMLTAEGTKVAQGVLQEVTRRQRKPRLVIRSEAEGQRRISSTEPR
jgi:hypothetical protein